MEKKICKLREITQDDYQFVYQLVQEFLKTEFSVTFFNLPPFDEFTKTYFKNDYKRYIITNDSNEDLGFVVITKDDEIGYFVSVEHQKKGIGQEAVRLLIEANPRQKYFATIHNDNEASIKLVKNLGFKSKGSIYEMNSN